MSFLDKLKKRVPEGAGAAGPVADAQVHERTADAAGAPGDGRPGEKAAEATEVAGPGERAAEATEVAGPGEKAAEATEVAVAERDTSVIQNGEKS